MDKEQIFNVVVKHMKQNSGNLDGVDIDPAQSMADYHISSLDIIETVSASMRELQISVPRARLMQLKSIGDLVDLFAEIKGNTERSASL